MSCSRSWALPASARGLALLVAAALASPAGAGDPAAPPPPVPGCRLVVPSLDFSGHVEAVRFQPRSGRTWFVSRSGEPHLELVKEPAPLAEGSYEVVAAALGGSILALLRLDERSGRTWAAFGNGGGSGTDPGGEDSDEADPPQPPPPPDPALGAWTVLAEPAPSPGDAAPPDPAAAAYRFRAHGLEGGVEAMRLRRDTGQAWALRDRAWAMIAEPASPGPGTYDGFFASMGKAGPVRFRFDEDSGRLWFERARAWTLAASDPKAAAVDATSGGGPGPFGCLRAPVGEVTLFLRTHAATGRAWLLGRGWAALREAKPLPPGAFEFRLLPGVVPGVPLPVRFDPRTGRTWLALDGEAWEEVDAGIEGGAGGAGGAEEPPADPGRFDVVVVAPSAAPYTTRLDRRTGAAWIPNGDGSRVRAAEPTALVESDYAFSCVTSGKGTGLLLRLDRRSGRWWSLSEGAWSPIAGLPSGVAGSVAPARFEASVLPTAEAAVATWCDGVTGQVLGLTPSGERLPGRAEASQEPEALPAGDYATGTAVFGGAGRGRFPARVRFERGSGRLWVETLDGPNLDQLVHRWKEMR